MQSALAAVDVAVDSDDPLVLLASDSKGILEQFYACTAYALQEYKKHSSSYIKPQSLLEDEANKNESTARILRIQAAISSRRDELMRIAVTDILSYLVRHRIKSTSADPFKLAYWFGIALSEKLSDEIDRKVALIITVSILDLFCQSHCSSQIRADLRSKMIMSIADGESSNDFGRHGIYVVFKVISNLQPVKSAKSFPAKPEAFI